MRRCLGAALAVVTLIACTGRVEVKDVLRFDESATGLDRIDVETSNGAVRLTGDDSDTVSIVATRVVRARDESRGQEYAQNVTVEITRERGTLRERTKTPSPNPLYIGSVSVEYSVSLPRHLSARAVSSNGAVDIISVDGSADAGASNGAVTLADIGGEAKGRSSNGAVTLSNVGSVVEATTSNGAVTVVCRAVSSSARIQSDNGAVTLVVDGALGAAVTMGANNGAVSASVRVLRGDIRLRAGSGAISITVEDTLAGGIDARAGSGTVHLHVPREAAFSLEATSGGKSISTPWGSGEREFGIEVNGGGPAVKLHSSSSSVRITE
ncbi:hypothetical protein CMK11_22465 [Candidatus Poribacteria bacterium]|nr:hypothetical protein [Candidatus Poribacteria bacterium]